MHTRQTPKTVCAVLVRPPLQQAALALGLLMWLLSAQFAPAASLPQAASAAGREMDRQISARLGQPSSPAQGISVSVLTPVDLNTLENANPLARQMQEELARWFVQAGYDVQEIRKGAAVLFEPENGEMLLTRRERLVGRKDVTGTAVVTGTYTVTPEHVRFNIRVVQVKDRTVLAMSTVTVPMNREVASLVRGGGDTPLGTPIEPTVVTLLP